MKNTTSLIAAIILAIVSTSCSKENGEPKACFTSEHDEESWTISFNNSCSENASKILWIFGDGDSSTTPNPIHLYPDTDPYTATLQVWNEDGEMDAMDMLVNPRNNCATCTCPSFNRDYCGFRADIQAQVNAATSNGCTCGDIMLRQ